MKNIKIFLSSVIASALPVLVSAQGYSMEGQKNAPGGVGGSIADMSTIVYNIEGALGFIFGAIAVICFLVAGILFLTAGGNPDGIKKARDAFLWGVVGVVVGIIAFSIIAIVSSIVGGGGFGGT